MAWLDEGLAKFVRFFEDERLELLDANALQTLLQDMLNVYFKAFLGEPATATSGVVFQGFDMAQLGGLDVQVLDPLGVAFDANGRLIIKPELTTFNITLDDNTDNYIYVFVADVESDSDGRRQWDRGTSSEDAVTDNTRFTPTVQVVKYNSPQTVHLFNDQSVPLVPLRYYITAGGSVFADLDIRQMLGARSAHTFTSDPGLGINDMLGFFNAIVTRIGQLTRASGLNWEDQTGIRSLDEVDTEVENARVSSTVGATTHADLKTAMNAGRRPRMTVGLNTGEGDYIGESGLRSALQETDVNQGGGDIFIKPGTYAMSAAVNFGRNGVRVTGTPNAGGISTSSSIIAPLDTANLNVTSLNGIIFDGLAWDISTLAGLAQIDLNGCSEITFRNCLFWAGATVTGPLMAVQGCTSVKFDHCYFLQGNESFPLVRFQGSDSTDVVFSNCRFEGSGGWVDNGGVAVNGLKFQKCHIQINEPTGATLSPIAIDLDQTNMFLWVTDCTFTDTSTVNRVPYVIDASGATGAGRGAAYIEGNTFILTRADNATIRVNSVGSRSRVKGNWLLSSVTSLDAILWRSLGGTAYGGDILDNQINLGNGAGTSGISVESAASAGTISDLRIEGNWVYQPNEYGIFVNSAHYGIRICNNHVRNAGISGITMSSSYVVVGGKINGNNITGGGGTGVTVGSHTYSPAILVRMTDITQDLEVAHNTIKSWATAFTSGPFAGIYISARSEAVQVHHNTCRNVGNSGAISAANQLLCSQIIVEMITAKGTTIAINHNDCEGAVYGSGVYFDAGDDGASSHRGCSHLKICDNVIRNTLGGSVVTAGIKVGSEISPPVNPFVADIPWNIDQLDVDNNYVLVDGANDATPPLYADAAIELFLTSTSSVFGGYPENVGVRDNSSNSGKDGQINIHISAVQVVRNVVTGNLGNKPISAPPADATHINANNVVA